MNYLNWINKMKIQFNSVCYQFYLIPTIKVTGNKLLFGYYSIEFIWLNRGVEIIWN
jgi:hypothetical protein